MGMSKAFSQWQERCCPVGLRDVYSVEFTLKALGFSHARPSDFVFSQWLCIKPMLYTAYRGLLAIGLICWIAIDMALEMHHQFGNRPYLWFLYATNWAFGAVTLTFFLLAVYCLVYNCPQRANEKYMLYQPIWLLYTIASNAVILASIVYWVMLSRQNIGVFSDPVTKIKHSLVAVLVLIDLCISSTPLRLVHVVYPVLAGIVYCVFSYLYWLCGGHGPLAVGQVYPGLNWNHPRTAILACLCTLFVLFFVHLFLCMIHYMRIQVSVCVGGRGYATSSVESREANTYYEFQTEEAPIEDDLLSTTTMESRIHRHYGTVE